MIMPADSPSIAVISGHEKTIRLEQSRAGLTNVQMRALCNYNTLAELPEREFLDRGDLRVRPAGHPAEIVVPQFHPEFIITRTEESKWTEGRAGMQYRDLIPGRLGGAVVASHIRIPEGGPVPDYVHYHRVVFQMIYCLSGWARLVYEDQGPTLIMNAGDLVLQPPGIRHRVLETSPGFEVIEIGCPAVHETWRDHEMKLPNPDFDPDREFSGRHFLHDKAKDADWCRNENDDLEVRQTGIVDATEGLADVEIVRNLTEERAYYHGSNGNCIVLLYVLCGAGTIRTGDGAAHQLSGGDCCSIPGNSSYQFIGATGLQMLVLSLEEKE